MIISLADAAKALGVSRTRALAFIAERRLPATRTTAGWALLRSDVEAFARIPRKAGRQPRHTAK